MRAITGLALAFITATTSLYAAEPNLRSYTADYKVSASGLDLGKLMVKLDLTADGYQYTKKTDASGLMRWISNDELQESSKGIIENGRPIPSKYHYLHTRRKGSKEEFATFTTTSVSGHYNGNAFELNTVDGIQDKASQDMVLMRETNANTERVTVNVIDKGKLRHQSYLLVGKEKIRVGSKSYDTLKLQLERDNNKRQTYFWLAPELGNIPVQFTHKDGEDKPTVQSRLVTLKIRQ